MIFRRWRVVTLIACAAAGVQAVAAPATPAGTLPAPRDATGGTTIVSDREAALGLYLMPWKGDAAARDVDLVPLHLDAPATSVDRQDFARRVRFHDSADDYKRAQYERRD